MNITVHDNGPFCDTWGARRICIINSVSIVIPCTTNLFAGIWSVRCTYDKCVLNSFLQSVCCCGTETKCELLATGFRPKALPFSLNQRYGDTGISKQLASSDRSSRRDALQKGPCTPQDTKKGICSICSLSKSLLYTTGVQEFI